jgi:uncharacterized protein (TIGR02391 family)
MDKKLEMTFTPNTIEHLGVRMYSTLPPVIAELIANSQDADAKGIHIYLNDSKEKEIIVSDDGHGMSFEDINSKFLRIGRNRRNDEKSQTSPGGRKVIGKKGLGKLSFFGIAHEIEVRTTQNYKRNSFVMKWNDILSGENREEQKHYSPIILEQDVKSEEKNGTVIVLKDIQRITDFDANSLADNLSKFFIIDTDFNICIKHNNEEEILIKNERKYSNLIKEIEWDIPDDIGLINDYEKRSEVKGFLITTEKPIPPVTNMKGITLFSRKKLVNLPEYFSDSTSSHFFTYLTGWLEVDFIDDLGEDVIGTNRQSLNWEHPDMVKLREFLQKVLRWLETDWREKRAKIKENKLEKSTGIKIGEWREHIPDNINDNLDSIINALTKDAELSDEKAANSLKGLQNIIKPYPYFHWRNLHPILQKIVFDYYKDHNYYTAVFEGVTEYVNKIKKKTASTKDDFELIKEAFSPDQATPTVNPILSVTKKYKRPDGTEFKDLTVKDIIQGHGLLARAMWKAFRNPKAHETANDLKNSGLYSEQDCLDALSLLSHLFYRLDNAETF